MGKERNKTTFNATEGQKGHLSIDLTARIQAV